MVGIGKRTRLLPARPRMLGVERRRELLVPAEGSPRIGHRVVLRARALQTTRDVARVRRHGDTTIINACERYALEV